MGCFGKSTRPEHPIRSRSSNDGMVAGGPEALAAPRAARFPWRLAFEKRSNAAGSARNPTHCRKLSCRSHVIPPRLSGSDVSCLHPFKASLLSPVIPEMLSGSDANDRHPSERSRLGRDTSPLMDSGSVRKFEHRLRPNRVKSESRPIPEGRLMIRKEERERYRRDVSPLIASGNALSPPRETSIHRREINPLMALGKFSRMLQSAKLNLCNEVRPPMPSGRHVSSLHDVKRSSCMQGMYFKLCGGLGCWSVFGSTLIALAYKKYWCHIYVDTIVV